MTAQELAQAVDTAIGHLRNGAVQAADDALSTAAAAFHRAQMERGEEPEPPPPPFVDLVIEALEFIASRFGNHQSLQRIIDAMRKLV
jgi:hypothetical protein